MIAPDHRIIIDIGSDYEIWVQVPEGNLGFKDVRGWTWTFKLYEASKGATITQYGSSITGDTPVVTIQDITLLHSTNDYDEIQAGNGWVVVKIDKTTTSAFVTGITSPEIDSFATEYNYRYTLDAKDNNPTPDIDSQEIRILRGKCAIRN